jgi:hypothetical protein
MVTGKKDNQYFGIVEICKLVGIAVSGWQIEIRGSSTNF